MFKLYSGRFERQANDYLKLKNIYHSPIYKDEEAKSVLEKLELSKLAR